MTEWVKVSVGTQYSVSAESRITPLILERLLLPSLAPSLLGPLLVCMSQIMRWDDEIAVLAGYYVVRHGMTCMASPGMACCLCLCVCVSMRLPVFLSAGLSVESVRLSVAVTPFLTMRNENSSCPVNYKINTCPILLPQVVLRIFDCSRRQADHVCRISP